jgi:ribosome modulation factor
MEEVMRRLNKWSYAFLGMLFLLAVLYLTLGFDSQAGEREYFYYRRGYAVGSYGAPSTCCPDATPANRRAWMRGWADGMKKHRSEPPVTPPDD